MMSLEQQYRTELEETLDKYFPKDPGAAEGGEPSKNNRSGALVLFADAMSKIHKTITAFGGCTICYGKGYSSVMRDDGSGQRMKMCECSRGQQLQDAFEI